MTEFRHWLICNGKSPKVASDTIARIKRVEQELKISVVEEYKKDQCYQLLSLFDNTGRNEEMKKYHTSLPIGKYYLSTYKYAIKLYVSFCETID